MLAPLAFLVVTAASPAAAKGTMVVLQDGYGTPTGFLISGFVIADKKEHAADSKASKLENLVDNMKALDADGVPAVKVMLSVDGSVYAATTAADGSFDVVVKGLKDDARLTLGDHDVAAVAGDESGSGKLTIFDDQHPFIAVVSDIDDTIVKTYVTDKKKLFGAALLKNGDQSEPMEGAAVAYANGQKAGVAGFFYVSASPQQLYRRLHTFLDAHAFPRGALILKRIGQDSLTDQQDYKLKHLEPLLAALPMLRVILVGDTGERDPETYAELRRRHPDRVVGIVIHKTARSDVRPERFPGMTLVDGAYPDEVIARLVAPAPR